MEISEKRNCDFLDCKDFASNRYGGLLKFCEYHSNGGMFGTGESYEQYQVIEQDFIEFIKVVPLVEIHLSVYSPVLRDIIIRSCVQIEIFFKEWAKLECSNNQSPKLLEKYNLKGEKDKNWSIKDYYYFKKYFTEHYGKIHVMPINIDISPFEKWTEGKAPEWWTTYNQIKHDGHINKTKANLGNALNAMAALFSLHCKNRDSSEYLKKYSSFSIDVRFGKCEVKVNDISTPLDAKRYLFKANHTGHDVVELVTSKQLKRSVKDINR